MYTARAQVSDAENVKVYRALLTQSGTSAPVATVLENSLGGTVVWTRNIAGEYAGTLTGAFPLAKTVVFMSAPSATSAFAYADSANQIIIEAGADDALSLPASVEIRVYDMPHAQVSDAENVKVYRALLSQSGTSAPTATVLENSLGGTLVWTRAAVGVYAATLAGVFTGSKTFFLTQLASVQDAEYLSRAYRASTDAIELTVLDLAGAPVDVFDELQIEIRVYP